MFAQAKSPLRGGSNPASAPGVATRSLFNAKELQRSSLRLGETVLGVVAVTLVRAAMTPLIGPVAMPFMLYLCVVPFVAWFGGLTETVAAIALSLAAGDWFFVAPRHTFQVGSPSAEVGMLMLVLAGVGVGLLSRMQHRAIDRAVRAEKAERNARLRFEATLASIGDAVIATDGEGRVTFVNPAAAALLKRPRGEALGKPLEDVFRILHEFTRAEVESPVAKVLRRGQAVALPHHAILVAKDGTEAAVDDSASPIWNSDGSIQGAVLVFRDVTESRQRQRQVVEQASLLKQAVAEARSQRERLGLALVAGKMGVFETNPGGRVFWWPRETYELFGVNPDEFRPTRDSFAALLHREDREAFIRYWDETIAERRPLQHEFRFAQANGKERWICCLGAPKYDDSGLFTYYSGIFLDTTERKEAEQVLRKVEKLAAAARLSAALAHGINNPLGAVANLVYIAKSNPETPASVVEMLDQAEREIERVAHATRLALGFYRERSRVVPIEIPELIESVLKAFALKIEEKKIRIVRGFMKCAPVEGVSGEIRQVFANLLANAIESVGEGGTVSVGTRPAEAGKTPAVEVIIADDGHGVAFEHVHRIFEPFFTTKSGTGTGLGLWAAKEIVERHQGSIEVQLPEMAGGGHGATFIVRLPGASGTRVAAAPAVPRMGPKGMPGSPGDAPSKIG